MLDKSPHSGPRESPSSCNIQTTLIKQATHSFFFNLTKKLFCYLFSKLYIFTYYVLRIYSFLHIHMYILFFRSIPFPLSNTFVVVVVFAIFCFYFYFLLLSTKVIYFNLLWLGSFSSAHLPSIFNF